MLQISLAWRSLASPKASVGVWLLVLIIFLLAVPVVLGQSVGVAGDRAGGVGWRGSGGT